MNATPGASVYGTVSFYDGTTLLGTGTLTQGTTTLTLRFNLGSHKFKAVYSGSATAAASSSGLLYETVGKAPTTVGLSTSPNGLMLVARVLPGFTGSPIGTVTFRNGNTVLGTAAVNGSGVASFTLSSPLASGSHITAVYSGCSCFLGSSSS